MKKNAFSGTWFIKKTNQQKQVLLCCLDLCALYLGKSAAGTIPHFLILQYKGLTCSFHSSSVWDNGGCSPSTSAPTADAPFAHPLLQYVHCFVHTSIHCTQMTAAPLCLRGGATWEGNPVLQYAKHTNFAKKWYIHKVFLSDWYWRRKKKIILKKVGMYSILSYMHRLD